MKTPLSSSLLVALSLAAAALAPATAQAATIGSYGYVVGTLVPGSNYIEPIPAQGNFLHYHFKIQTLNGPQYDVAIDIKNGHLYNFPYRIMSLNPANAIHYGPIWGASSGYHAISMGDSGGAALEGALDYIRHQGLLLDMAWDPWTFDKADPTSDPTIFELPQWDALFDDVTKVIAFGKPFVNNTPQGTVYGLHLVHQNQGDQNTTFLDTNGTFQDGGVIFEYAPTAEGPVRKALMTRFADQPGAPGQVDFSYTTDPDGAGPLVVGQAAPFSVVTEQFSGTSHTYGPFNAEQFQVLAGSQICQTFYDVDIYVGTNRFVSPTNYIQSSTNSRLCAREFVRAYSNPGTNFYVYVRSKVANSPVVPITFSFR